MPNVLFDALLGNKSSSASSFLTSGQTGSTSYSEFFGKVAQTANALIELGVKPDHRVTVQVEKSTEALALYFATIAVGAVYSPLNTDYTARELEYFIQDAKPSLVVCGSSSQVLVQSAAVKVGAVVKTLLGDGSGTLSDYMAGMSSDFAPIDRDQDDLAAILYTSGTTGLSKGAMLTHSNLLSNAKSLKLIWHFTHQDVLLHALPIFHAHGLFVAVNTIALAGGSMIFHPRFTVDDVIRDLPCSTTMMGVPTFYTRLLSDSRFDQELNSRMRLFISGSAPLLATTHNEFEQRTGHRILERYGMTETTMITSNPYDGARKAGFVGRPLPGVSVRVRDPQSGATLDTDQIGILEVSGPNVFKGYWGMPDKTAQEFREDGYFVTGDIVFIDDEGYISIVGRDKDLIISGGYNVYPKEIELLIDRVEDVIESAVIGVPHPDFGEAVVAIVAGKRTNKLDESIILSSIAPNLAKFKHPKHVEFLEELPRNTMGKVQKASLRNQYKSLFSSAALRSGAKAV